MNASTSPRYPSILTVLGLCGALAFGPGRAAAQGVAADEQPGTWSVRKLPGSGTQATRMAAAYQPMPIDVRPAAPAYQLPLDLSKVTNKDLLTKMPELRDKAFADKVSAALARNGFVALATGREHEVAAFYTGVQNREAPIFISSDAVLHLYHVQFDQTLQELEERLFVNDAALIGKAVQAEATELHDKLQGELKEAARLLVGYSTVPAILLRQVDMGTEARAALAAVQTWTDRASWRQQQDFIEKYGELLPILSELYRVRPNELIYSVKALKASLLRYAKAHPPESVDDLIPEICRTQVQNELGLIAAHRGFDPSPLFVYKEDYSQYAPRGHYTRTKKLRQYFKAMMWFGRMTFLIRGGDGGQIKAVIPMAEARKQTLAACMLAGMMDRKLSDGRTIAQVWDRMYAVTAYYVGLADDLTPYDYRQALRGAIGESVTAADLTNPTRFFELRKLLAQMRKPEIYGGLGDMVGPPASIADEKTLAEALAMTQGMRLMGQRYVPDSFILGRLVYPTVGLYTGNGAPFTLVHGDGGAIRGFPRGLDVMAALGSARARHWLKQLGDDTYQKYDQTLAKLKEQFDKIDTAGWNRNLYWSWLYALKALLGEYPAGYPTFMQTEAWRDKQLSAVLASWSQLRHDTILYAKQSYTPRGGSGIRQPKMVEGYVEPVPEFYMRLMALSRMTRQGLTALGAVDYPSRRQLYLIEQALYRLVAISQRELTNEKLTPEDYAFIRTFGDQLTAAVAGTASDGLDTTIIADVHTDGNTGQVLEEGTGHLHPMIVVYPMPDGGLVAGIGAALSHYEFKHPMRDRLTDEAWTRMLGTPKAPALPEWAETFTLSPPKFRLPANSGP